MNKNEEFEKEEDELNKENKAVSAFHIQAEKAKQVLDEKEEQDKDPLNKKFLRYKTGKKGKGEEGEEGEEKKEGEEGEEGEEKENKFKKIKEPSLDSFEYIFIDFADYIQFSFLKIVHNFHLLFYLYKTPYLEFLLSCLNLLSRYQVILLYPNFSIFYKIYSKIYDLIRKSLL